MAQVLLVVLFRSKLFFLPVPLNSKVGLWFFVEGVVCFTRNSSVDFCLNMSGLRLALPKKKRMVPLENSLCHT